MIREKSFLIKKKVNKHAVSDSEVDCIIIFFLNKIKKSLKINKLLSKEDQLSLFPQILPLKLNFKKKV